MNFDRVLAPHQRNWLSPGYYAAQIKIDGSIRYFFLGLSIWILFHSYKGIYHDATLYTVQALSYLGFDFSQDLFFKFGSQQDFAFFPSLHGVAIKVFGVGSGTEWLYWVATVSCFFALWQLLNVKPAYRVLATLLISIGNNYYDHYPMIFRFSEQFLTARLFSEALSLFALALWFQHRRYWSIGTALLSVIFHPLIGIWSLVVVVALFLGIRLTLVISFFALFSCVVLRLVSNNYVDVFSSSALFSIMNTDWVTSTKIDSPWLFADAWMGDPIFRLLTFLSVVAWVAMRIRDEYRAAMFTLAVVASSSFVIFFLLGSMENPFSYLIQVQLWRVQWLLMVFALVGVVFVVEKEKSKIIVSSIVLAVLAASWVKGVSGLVLILVLIFFYEFKEKLSKPLALCLSFFICVASFLILSMQFSSGFLHSGEPVFYDVFTVFVRVVFIAYFLMYLLSMLDSSWLKKLKIPILFAMCGAALYFHDGRSKNKRLFENSIPKSDSMAELLEMEVGETLYILDSEDQGRNLQRSWLYLKRPYYYVRQQAAGQVFNSGTSAEATIRKANLLSRGVLEMRGNDYFLSSGIYSMTPLKLQDYCFDGIDVLIASFSVIDTDKKVRIFNKEFAVHHCEKGG